MVTEVIEETETSTDTGLVPMYKVLLHNDDKNSFQHVMMAVAQVFNYEFEKTYKIVMEAHETGVALAKVEPLEHAEMHKEQLQAFSLTATIEPAE